MNWQKFYVAFVDSFHVFNKPRKSQKLATTLYAHVGMYPVLINFLYDCYFYLMCVIMYKREKSIWFNIYLV